MSYRDLAALLLQRGMVGDVREIQQRLEDVGYQRLQAYWSDRQSLQGINFDDVWTQYCFDRQIRLVLMDAIERIEVAVRSRLVHCFCEAYGPFGYLDHQNFTNCTLSDHAIWLKKLDAGARKSSLRLVQDFFKKYSDAHLPLWLACELMDFGSTVFFFSSVERPIKVKVSKALGAPNPVVLESWLRALNDVRNACAHHNRVWNRKWVKTLPVPVKVADWHVVYDAASGGWVAGKPSDLAFDMKKTGGILTLCHCLLKNTASSSHWRERLLALVAEPRFSAIPLHWMGLPANWQLHPLWQS